MTRKLLIVMLAVASLSACKREAEPPATPATPAMAPAAAAAAADDAATVAGTDATAAVETTVADANVQPAADTATASFDSKGFAGEFGGDGDARLAIGADGTYALNDGSVASSGTWTLEADGAHILLDPDSKAEPDRRYALVSNDELRAVDDGKVLRRR